MTHQRYSIIILLLACVLGMPAQQYFTLQPDELKIDSVLPHFTFVHPLGPHYADSVYEVALEYPDFAPMKRREVRRYKKITGEQLPEWPVIDSYVGVSRRQGSLYASFAPFVRRDGKNLKLTSFKLRVNSRAKEEDSQLRMTREEVSHLRTASSLSTSSSPFLTGRWVKISIPETGFYQLTDSFLQAAGFDNPQRVKVYGFGGAPHAEKFTASYLTAKASMPQ